MKHINKIIVGVAVIIIGFGSWYFANEALIGKDDGEKLGEVKGEDFTDKDFMDSIKDNVDTEGLQGLYLEYVVEKYSDDDLEETFYEDYKKELEDIDDGDLEEEDKEVLKQEAAQDAGMVNIVQELGLVTEEDIDEAYKENNKEYELRVALVQEGVKPKRVKEIFEDDKDVEDKVDELGEKVSFVNSIEYTDFTVPEDYPDVSELEKGDIMTEDIEDMTYVIELRDVGKVDKEDAERHIIQHLSEGKFDSVSDILTKMEDKGLIKMKKDLREYIGVDEEKVKE